jgi:hypothetical protein
VCGPVADTLASTRRSEREQAVLERPAAQANPTRIDPEAGREAAEAWVHMGPTQVDQITGASSAGNGVDVERRTASTAAPISAKAVA